MAKTISEEELQLRKRARRRLIGAIALVTIVAVFLPMLLDHEPKPVNQDISIQIPSPSSGTFTSKIVPVVPAAKSAVKPAPDTPAKSETPAKSDAPLVAAAPAAKPAAATPPAYDTEAAPPRKPAARPPAKSAPAPKAGAQAQPDAKSAGGYVVQVAALNDADKAKHMQEQIAAAGVKSYTEIVPTTKGNVTRVRAGPFASRDEAEKTRDKLKGMGLNGNIVPR